MKVRSIAGIIATGTQKVVSLPDIPQGARVLSLEVSVEDTTILQVKGIDNLSLYYDNSGTLTKGLRLGGDFSLKLKDLQRFVDQDILEVNGTVEFLFDQSTGVNVDFVVVLIYSDQEKINR